MKINDARKFAQHVAPHVIRPARIIWNQVIGAIFLLFAIPAFFKTWEYCRVLDTEPQSVGRIAFALPFALIMAFFGISSFLRARRLSRQ